MKKFLLSAFVFFATAFPLYAASIQNSDVEPRTLVIKQEGVSFQVIIEAKGYIQDLCSDCTIEVLGFSIMDVEREKLLIIDGGHLKVKEH